jgi:molybdate transport system substrate-binding protein
MRQRSVLVSLLVGAVLGPALTGCDQEPGAGDETTLTVFAAASLTTTFTRIAEEFEAEHEGVEVELSFGGSSDLVAQIQQGAPADVLASADLANMDKLAELQGQEPQAFATNTLQIAVAPGNPLGIAGLSDLTGPDVALVLCAPEVPCGAAAQQAAAAGAVDLAPVSEEQSVTDVLGKVTSGEADAGLVYVTDVIAAGGAVLGVDFPESSAAVNTYPITTVEGHDSGDLAEEFVELVLGETGRSILEDAGFAPAAAP